MQNFSRLEAEAAEWGYKLVPKRGKPRGRRLEYAESDIERAATAFREGASYKELAKKIRNRKGDRHITPTQLKRRIDEYERRKAG